MKNLLNALSFAIAIAVIFCSCNSAKVSVQINNELNDETIIYALSRFENLADNGEIKILSGDADLRILTEISDHLNTEAYKIETTGKDVTVTGGDATGVMYGLLHIQEQLAMGKKTIANIEESPGLSFRAIKFNLPWDSYRRGKALQLHEETCRDTLFWRSFLDMMAENRFNKLTLWNLHPFNYMVKTEKYPEACGFTDDEMVGWEAFWNSIFRMARERGIETYVLNWNIFVSPEFAKAHNVAEYSIDGRYFINQGDTSEIVKDYTREVVREVINKYPDLTGLGITLGEGMGGMTADQRNEWILESFIEGMRMADRKIKFIYRAPLSAGTGSEGTTDPYVERMTRVTLDTLTCVDGPITIELKFNWSHAFSCVELIKVHGGELTDAYWNPPPQNYNLAWMMRNEDFFVLRWGQTDFIRDHIAENARPWVNGYFVGSETYIPATDYITSLPNTSYNYAFERQWMFYKTMGRLLYNAQTPDKVFSDAFELKFPGHGEKLFQAQQKVSRVPLVIGSYWNATWDNTLYSEGMLSIMDHGNMKLMSLPQFANKQPMNPAYISIKEFLANSEIHVPGKISPLELADSLDSFCMRALEIVKDIPTTKNTDLLYEVSDIKTWAFLGMYLSNKIRAALEYQRFLNDGDKDALQVSVQWLEVAGLHWAKVVEVTTPIYDPMPMQHNESNGDIPFHWSLVEEEVQEELKWLKNLALSAQNQMPDMYRSTTLDHDWQPLFNGKDLNGWEIKCVEEDKDYEFWKVEDGAIVCNSMDSENHNYVWLQSENEYADFELRLKFQVSRENIGNSGVQFRSRYDEKAVVEGTSAGWLDGPQADIDPNDPWRNGLLYDETRETKRWIYPDLPNWEISKELHSPKKVIFYWEDEETGWNDMIIRCKGMHVKVIVNNVIVTDYDGTGVLDDEIHQKLDVGTKGHIALQLHKNSRNNIRFKDIEIRQIE